ncbi:hypothetical protein [Acinetobacter guillouiae]
MDAFEQLFIHLDLQLNNIRLVPLSFEHEQGLAEVNRTGFVGDFLFKLGHLT